MESKDIVRQEAIQGAAVARSAGITVGPTDSARVATGLVFDIKKFSLHDGPGIRTSIFLKGCPLSCAWCHNPEGISSDRQLTYRADRCIECGSCHDICPEQAIHRSADGKFLITLQDCDYCGLCADECATGARELIGREMTPADLMVEILKDVTFYDESQGGVTFTGGEPLLQVGFLGRMLEECQRAGIHTAVDTTGLVAPKALAKVRDRVGLFLYDLKLMDEGRHREFTGVSNKLILANLRRLSAAGSEITVRVPVIPGINDDTANIALTGEFVSSLAGTHQVEILPYHNTAIEKYGRLGLEYSLPAGMLATGESMDEIAAQLSGFGLQVTIGGQ